MFRYIIGKKSNMSQQFTAEGKRVPVTRIVTSPCYIVDIKKNLQNGTIRLILGFQEMKKANKPTQGNITKAGLQTPLRFLREFVVDFEDSVAEINEAEGKKSIIVGETTYTVGTMIKASDLFKEGDNVDVSGTSKGKGFQGVVKRYNFRGGPRTHGQSDRERAPGSIGATTTPGRVFKGMKMAGRMGSDRVTVQNLRVVRATEEDIVVQGLIPGIPNGLIEVRKSTR